MKCPNCQREIMLAKICPYCSTRIKVKPRGKKKVTPFRKVHHKDQGKRGEFKGRIRNEKTAQERMEFTPIQLTLEYMKDPAVPFSKKLTIIGAVAYILSPIDLIPAFLFPLSILDDAIVIGYLLRTLSFELTKYRAGYY